MNWLDKLEKKFRRFGIKNLMAYIVGLNAVVFFLYLLDASIVWKIALIPSQVLNGEVWRLITFIFIPPTYSPIWLVFVLYFYYLIGSTLEHEWGTFKFNFYYFVGVIATIISAFIFNGFGTPFYLNLSLFLAFAYIFPNYEVLLFFILPIKIKYLAWLDAAFLIWTVITGSITDKATVIVSILNFLLFFGKDIIIRLKTGRRTYYHKKSFSEKIPKDFIIHRCEICGKSEKDGKDLEFRYCVDCDGDHEYCMEHLYTHEHVKEKIE